MTYRDLGLLVGNYVLFAAATILLAALQCSLWLQIFGHFPAPNLWLPAFVYWILYRHFRESLIMVYLLSIVIAPFSAMHLGLLLLINLILCGLGYFFKTRIYWTGFSYFMLVTGTATVAFPVIHIAASWALEKNPITDPQVFEWVLRVLLTTLAALPLFQLFSWFDRLTKKQQPKEMEVVSHV